MQTTLSRFLSREEPSLQFCLNGKHSFFEKSTPKASFISEVKVRLQGNFFVLNLWNYNKGLPYALVPRVTDKSLLISMLQKAVRRCIPDVAASIALEIAHCDPLLLARRLSIIAIEDVASDKNLVVSVWYMLAFSNGAHPTESDIIWMVQYAHALASNPNRDERFRKGHVPSAINSWKRGHEINDNVSLALLIRAAFGGMRGDVEMLLRAASVDHTSAPFLEFQNVEVGRLSRDMAILDAIDFHCDPSIPKKVSETYNITEDAVRTMIWENSSSTNKRLEEKPIMDINLWNTILPYIQRIQNRRMDFAFGKC